MKTVLIAFSTAAFFLLTFTSAGQVVPPIHHRPQQPEYTLDSVVSPLLKTAYYYNASGKEDSSVNWNRESLAANWKASWKNETYYDSIFGKAVRWQSYNKVPGTNTWILQVKDEYILDKRGNAVFLFLTRKSEFSDFLDTVSTVRFYYNSANSVIKIKSCNHMDDGRKLCSEEPVPNNNNRVEKFYDSSGNMIKKETYHSWNSSDGTYVAKETEFFQYDNQKNLISERKTGQLSGDTGSFQMHLYKYTYNYRKDVIMKDITDYSRRSKVECEYDLNHNITLRKYYDWDTTSKAFVYLTDQDDEYIYDSVKVTPPGMPEAEAKPGRILMQKKGGITVKTYYYSDLAGTPAGLEDELMNLIHDQNEGDYLLYDMTGRLLSSGRNESLKKDLSLIPAGTYIVHSRTESGYKTYRILRN